MANKSSTHALRILLVEDCEDDALLVLMSLRADGYQVDHERVYTRKAMLEALKRRSWDAVICDYHMPEFSAPEALELLRKQEGLDLPFIIVSGAVGEEIAVQAMKAGASDYVMKDRLTRLGASLGREVREAQVRREAKENALRAERATLEKQIAEAEIQAKSRFFASMSHELRSPLNAILGYSELLEREIGGVLSPMQTEFVTNIMHAGRHLTAVVTDILDLAKIEAGRLDLTKEPVSMWEVANFVNAMFVPEAKRCGVALHTQVPNDLPQVLADPVRIKQVLCNLVSNAIKFTPSGQSVWVEACQRDKQVELSVRDEGVGIKSEDLPRLFRDFERVRAAAQPYVEGTGLGLSLTKRLVELHGGSIHAKSELGRGSTFSVVLPSCVNGQDLH